MDDALPSRRLAACDARTIGDEVAERRRNWAPGPRVELRLIMQVREHTLAGDVLIGLSASAHQGLATDGACGDRRRLKRKK